MLAMRAVEGAGVGASISAVLGSIVLAVMLFQGRSGWGVAAGLVALGAVAGTGWGLLKRPTLIEAAGEIDRQLNLHDLLATAMFARRSAPRDGWSMSVVAIANARCQSILPASLVLNRFGVRTWGGVGLSVALVMTLGVLSSLPAPLVARNVVENERFGVRDGMTGVEQKMTSVVAPLSGVDSERVGETPESGSPSDNYRAEKGSGSSGKGGTDGTASSSGMSSGYTADSAATGLRNLGRAASGSGEDGDTVSNGASGSTAVASHGTTGAGGTSGGAAVSAAPPWEHEDWRGKREKAMQEVRSGPALDAYAPVVREYFQPR
ncbi:MAG TPA: hypothetical protein VF669_23610 [Tepidisphaeraceae bacterium]